MRFGFVFLMYSLFMQSTTSFIFNARKLTKIKYFSSSSNAGIVQTASMDILPDSRASVEKGHVYYVATPIGNLQDISKRALDVLKKVDYVCAEDTRTTISLLRLLSIPHKELLSHHAHNTKGSIPKILELVRTGHSVAVVSDAGTPGISDPGTELAYALGKENIPLHPVPGASAVVAALSVCGFPATPFTFMGFLSTKTKDRKSQLQALYNAPHTVVLYEAPHRVVETFQDILATSGNHSDVNIHIPPYCMRDREVVVCRELTKMHEEIRRGTVSDILAWLEGKGKEHKQLKNQPKKDIRGEFCIVFGPAPTANKAHSQDAEEENGPPQPTLEEVITNELLKLKCDQVNRKEAVQLVVDICKVPKSVVYSVAMKLDWPFL